jgi:basic amino acid/polyamine antiporter, APA family
MAARVIYGMSKQSDLPAALGAVHARTGTPLIATALVVAATLVLALTVPFERLAEGTSLATLAVFATVNLSLLRLRARREHSPHPHAHVPLWVPAAGLATCVAMIALAVVP